MNDLRTYVLITIVIILYIYLEFLKSSKSKKPLQAKIHQTKELKKFKPKKGTDQYIHISENIQFDLKKKASKNNIILCLASSGSGKTFSFINNNLLLNMSKNKVVTDVGRSMIENEVNGFTFKKYYEDHNFDVKEVDLYNFKAVDKFNPLYYVKLDNGTMIKNNKISYKDVIDTDFVESILKTIIPDDKNGDAFWTSAVRNNVLTIILYMFYKDEYNNKRNFITVCKLFNEFLEKESNQYKIEEIIDDFETEIMEMYEDENGIKHVKVNENLGVSSVIERLKGMKNDLTADGDYASSIKGTFKSLLSDKILKGNVIRTIEEDTMNIESIADQKSKTIWFITINDSNQNYNFIASMFYVTMFYMINSVAKESKNNRLERDVIFYLDEFGSSVYIDNFPTIVSTIRKKMGEYGTGGTILMMVIQDFAQLKEKYGETGESIIVSNSSMKLYLGVDDFSSMEKVSKWSGEVINRLDSDSKSYKSSSHSQNESLHALVSINYLNQLENKGHRCLLFMGGKVYEDKMLPFVKMKQFKEYIKVKK